MNSLRIAYLSHSIRSDWNNGNAHFLRGLLRAVGNAGHHVSAWEPAMDWSLENLLQEPSGRASLEQFTHTYPDLNIHTYTAAEQLDEDFWREHLAGTNAVILHEWNPPALARVLLSLRAELGYKLLFHDTHHRASSSPEQIQLFGIDHFDAVLAFGEVLRTLYRESFGIRQVFTLHEAADTATFKPIANVSKAQDVVWIGNWGDDERSAEIREFLLVPAAAMRESSFTIYGVRYPQDGLAALAGAGVRYGGYLPNLTAPVAYAASRLTVHIPRRQYANAMTGIPTIRVFEALACGIPLISAPWDDIEQLFRPGDFTFVSTGEEMRKKMRFLLQNAEAAADQAAHGMETVLARHTCAHRAAELTAILEGLPA